MAKRANQLAKVRQRGLIGLFAYGSQRWHMLKTKYYYSPHFARIGKGSIVIKPLMIRNCRGIWIGDNTQIRNGVRLELVERCDLPLPELRVGNNVLIEQFVHIACCGLITIGDDVAIAKGCAIVDVTHPFDLSIPVNVGYFYGDQEAFVTIGRRAYLGAGAVILPNVRVGECAVVGANAVVTEDVPDRAIVAGVPATVIGWIS